MSTPSPSPAETQKRLETIRQRCGNATEGPWTDEQEVHGGLGPGGGLRLLFRVVKAAGENLFRLPDTIRSQRDAAFIAHSRDDVPFLLAYIRTLEKEHREMRAGIAAAMEHREEATEELHFQGAGTAAGILDELKSLLSSIPSR